MTLSRRLPSSARILKKIKKTVAPIEGETHLINRNPRNLEFLRIAHKPLGYFMDKPGRAFWNKLTLTTTGKYVTVQMVHFEKGPIVEASTSEWALKKQLFKTSDHSAYTNLAKVFAQRCLESGFIEMACDLKPTQGGKAEAFLKTVREEGLILEEPFKISPQLEVNHYVGRKEKPYGDWEAE